MLQVPNFYVVNFVIFLSRISSILFCIAITNNFMYQFYKSKPNISSELTLNRFSAKIGKSNNFWDFPKPSCVFTKKFSRNVERACVLLSYTGFMKNPMLARAFDHTQATDRLITIVLPEEQKEAAAVSQQAEMTKQCKK